MKIRSRPQPVKGAHIPWTEENKQLIKERLKELIDGEEPVGWVMDFVSLLKELRTDQYR